MDATKLKQFISDTSLITKNDVAELETSLSKHPYCSTLHILYLKALSNANDIQFDESLRKSSIHVNDREQLFNIINTSSDIQSEVSLISSVVEESIPETAAIEETTLSENTEDIENVIIDEREEKTGVKENINSEIENQKEIIVNPLETEIIAGAIESNLIFDVENIAKTDKTSFDQEAASISEISDNIELDFSGSDKKSQVSTSESTPSLNTENKTSKKDLVAHKDLSFSEWLKIKKSGIDQKTESPEENLVSIPEVEEKETILPEPKLTKKEINQLLDKFIEEEPRLSKPKKDFYNPVENAKKSLDDSDILVSETLAKIYHLQKNYPKAIKAYEQLCLLNPKKKSFFANQIKKIKKEELK